MPRVHGLAGVPPLTVPPPRDLQQLWGRRRNPPEPLVQAAPDRLFRHREARRQPEPLPQSSEHRGVAPAAAGVTGRNGSPRPDHTLQGHSPLPITAAFPEPGSQLAPGGCLLQEKLAATAPLGEGSEPRQCPQLGVSSCVQTLFQFTVPGGPSRWLKACRGLLLFHEAVITAELCHGRDTGWLCLQLSQVPVGTSVEVK